MSKIRSDDFDYEAPYNEEYSEHDYIDTAMEDEQRESEKISGVKDTSYKQAIAEQREWEKKYFENMHAQMTGSAESIGGKPEIPNDNPTVANVNSSINGGVVQTKQNEGPKL